MVIEQKKIKAAMEGTEQDEKMKLHSIKASVRKKGKHLHKKDKLVAYPDLNATTSYVSSRSSAK